MKDYASILEILDVGDGKPDEPLTRAELKIYKM